MWWTRKWARDLNAVGALCSFGDRKGDEPSDTKFAWVVVVCLLAKAHEIQVSSRRSTRTEADLVLYKQGVGGPPPVMTRCVAERWYEVYRVPRPAEEPEAALAGRMREPLGALDRGHAG
jgi:hypothetical protein